MRLWVNLGFAFVIGSVLLGTDVWTQKSRAAEDGATSFDMATYLETINARLAEQTAKASAPVPGADETPDAANLFEFLPAANDGWSVAEWSAEAQARLDGSEGTLAERFSPDRLVGALTPSGRNSLIYMRGEDIVRIEISRLRLGAAGESAHIKAMRVALGAISSEDQSFAVLGGINFSLVRRDDETFLIEGVLADHIRIRAEARASADDLRLLLGAVNYGGLAHLTAKETGRDAHLEERAMPQVSTSRKPAFRSETLAQRSSAAKDQPQGIIINRGTRKTCGSLDKGCSLIKR